MAEMSEPIRWLHLSDFHTGHDRSGQRRMFKDLLTHIKQHMEEEEAVPDLVFISGDIAYSGEVDEYRFFFDEFFFELATLLSDDLPANIFLIPGNHDVKQNELDDLGLRQFFSKFPKALDPDDEGKKLRQRLIERFQDYIEANDLHDCTPVKGEWLRDDAASYLHKIPLQRNGIKQQIGIVGLNTAWLSGKGNDQGCLTPGKLVVAQNLDQLDDCALKIVLGHHRVDWFMSGEQRPILARFARSDVIYLHGDQHEIDVRLVDGGGQQFLTIEPGAAFQGRDDKVWANRLLWCNLYLDERLIHIHPRIWSIDHDEWSLDSSLPTSKRVKGTDYWQYELPKAGGAADSPTPVKKTIHKGDMSKPPFEGWRFTTSGFLDRRRNTLSEDEALSYFDGGDVTWEVALSEKVPRREVVQTLSQAVMAPRRTAPDVTVLLGGGGEGKSTALFQAAVDLLSAHPDWTILWQEKAGAPLPAEFWSQTSLNEAQWLLVIDEADLILQQIYDLTKTLPAERRSQFHLLLCCRDTDWRSVGANALAWNRESLIKVPGEPLSGITEADAAKVVRAWKECKKDGSGLGKLQGLSEPEAVQRLVALAKEETIRNEGAFLGAMLQTRYGDNLRNHVLNLLNSLNRKPLKSPHEEKTLLDAFSYIAVLHAEKITILTEEILAERLGVNWERETGYMYRHVISLLGREVGTDIRRGGSEPGKRFPTILTRHRMIAEASVEVLSESFYFAPELWATMFKQLVRTALALYEEHRAYVPELKVWRQLPAYFSKQKGAGRFFHTEQERIDFATDLALLLVEHDKTDPLYVTQLAEIYTDNKQHSMAVQTFRRGAHDISSEKRDKLYYHDWAKSEGQGRAENVALSAWLDSIALSTSSPYPRRDDDYTRDGYMMMFLHGLSMNFKRLAELHPNSRSIFRFAWAAAVQHALRLHGNYMTADTRQQLKQSQAEIEREGLDKPSYPFETIIEGMIAAWKLRETTELDSLLPPASALDFDL